ncbi:hypothetical protein L211DRAFT_851809 [Terfezia boudieri ATCC MYA-4762]|uniref:Uncharacterized protein n=1 Tax=Terfezia boudieri ATCC MYA-4762 TaxID=1051890 RepID=A0A3N4LDW3_9PEZI|nr:hypothetical protein L211DRAFT_851809 [Terfezia boudieri ATCC MYA-4762]
MEGSLLENCFEASQVKFHGPFLPSEVDDMHEVEDEILGCIQVVHPGLQLSPSALQSQFIDPPNETVEDPVSDIENGILAAYLPNEADEPDAEVSLTLLYVNKLRISDILKVSAIIIFCKHMKRKQQ